MNRNLKKTPLEQYETIFENVLKMFKRRGYIKNEKKLYDKYKPTSIIMNNFDIKSDIDNKMYHIFIHNININSIKKNSDIDDFLSKNTNNIKILLVKSINKKIFTQIFEIYNKTNSEVFKFSEMEEDITDKVFIPKHILLNKEDREDIYKLFKNDIPKISLFDPMARYYKAKINDIFKIERNSILSGKSIAYRIVTHNKDDINIFF